MLNRKWNLKIKHVEKYMALVIWCLGREIEDINELLTIPKIKRVNYSSRLYRDATTQGHDMFSLTARTFTSHWHHGRESIPTHILVYLFNLGSSWFSPTSGVLFFSRSLRSWNASFTQKHRPCKDRARCLSFANKTLTVDVYSKNYTVTYMSIHTSKSILNQRKIYNKKKIINMAQHDRLGTFKAYLHWNFHGAVHLPPNGSQPENHRLKFAPGWDGLSPPSYFCW